MPSLQIRNTYNNAINLCEYKIMQIETNFGDLKTLCDFKLCDYIVRKIHLTINFAQLKFVRNLIKRSGSDPHKAHK